MSANFRYIVKPKTRVSVFEPNRVDGDPMNMRGTVLGALVKENLLKLPKLPMASILWEVIWLRLTNFILSILTTSVSMKYPTSQICFHLPVHSCHPGQSGVRGPHQDHIFEAQVLADLWPDCRGEVRRSSQRELRLAMLDSCRAWPRCPVASDHAPGSNSTLNRTNNSY